MGMRTRTRTRLYPTRNPWGVSEPVIFPIPLSHVFTSHLLAENCALIRSGGKKGIKGKLEAEGKSLSCLFISNFINVLGTQIQRKA